MVLLYILDILLFNEFAMAVNTIYPFIHGTLMRLNILDTLFICGDCGNDANSKGDFNKHICLICHTCFSTICAGSSVTIGLA